MFILAFVSKIQFWVRRRERSRQRAAYYSERRNRRMTTGYRTAGIRIYDSWKSRENEYFTSLARQRANESKGKRRAQPFRPRVVYAFAA